jgi:hypothetical protein
VLGHATLLNVVIIVDTTNSVETAEVVVCHQEVEGSVGLMQVHGVERELGHLLHEMEPESWMMLAPRRAEGEDCLPLACPRCWSAPQ